MPRLIVLCVVLAVILLACSGDASDQAPVSASATSLATAGPTEAPTSTPTPEPAPEPTATPLPPAQAPPARQPPPTQPPPPPPAPAGTVTVNISAVNLAFNRGSITVPAGASVTVVFQNNDTAVPHDFGVSIAGVPHTETCSGPCTNSITFTAPAGAYPFFCTIHPEMVGSFIAQ